MALPTTITTGGDLVAGCGGPFLSSGGNVYVIVRDDVTNSKIRAFKATDPTSSFSNVGTDPTMTSGGTVVGMDAVQDGDNIHVVTRDRVTDTILSYHIFSMSSDSWTTTNESIVTAMDNDTPYDVNVAVDIRSDGDIIVLYNGARVSNMGTARERVYYARREASVWTADVLVDNGGATSWFASGIVRGSSDRMHLYFFDGGAADFYQRCLRSANTLETFPSALDASATSTSNQFVKHGISYDSSGTQKVRFPFGDSTANTVNSAKCDSADSPTMSQDSDITGAVTASIVQFSNSYVADGTTLYHVYRDTSSDIRYQSNANDGGWSASTTFYTGTASDMRVNLYQRGSDVVIAMIFTETDPKYHEIVLRSVGSPFDMDATASVTWGGRSTAASNLDADAAASLTWNGTGLYPAALDSDAVASVTWNGAEVAAATAAEWDSDAAASLTWNGTGLYPAALDSDAAASLTWNGISTAAADLDSDATASLTWNGAATAASTWDADAVATLTWAGTMVVNAAWDSDAAASLTWNGVEVTVASAAFSIAAAASVTWNGAALAYSAFSSTAIATLTWNGASTSTAAMDADAAASLTWNGISTAASSASITAIASVTWNGTGLYPAALSSTAAASVTWNGAAVATINAAFNSTAAASVTWNGAAVASSSWSALSAASVTWNGISTASTAWQSVATASITWNGRSTAAAVWDADALATITWNGAEIAGNFAEGAASITISSSATFNGASSNTSAFSFTATADAQFVGFAEGETVEVNLDGWKANRKRRKELELQEDEDIAFIATALAAYLGQYHEHN